MRRKQVSGADADRAKAYDILLSQALNAFRAPNPDALV